MGKDAFTLRHTLTDLPLKIGLRKPQLRKAAKPKPDKAHATGLYTELKNLGSRFLFDNNSKGSITSEPISSERCTFNTTIKKENVVIYYGHKGLVSLFYANFEIFKTKGQTNEQTPSSKREHKRKFGSRCFRDVGNQIRYNCA
uniref:Uncharacterized protein n=1 Tax=Glossina austeni TaxID=7395 RepID=A0A1A9V823_GLOAU